MKSWWRTYAESLGDTSTVKGSWKRRAAELLQGAGGGSVDVLPEGATALYDFKNGVYNNGSVLTLSDVLGNSIIFSGTFNPARVVLGTGLIGDPARISLIDEALTSAQAPVSIFMQINLSAAVSVIFEHCTASFATDIITTVTTISEGSTQISDQNSSAAVYAAANPLIGLSKYAYTLAASGMIAALNGVLFDDLDVPPAYISSSPALTAPFDEVAILVLVGSVIERIVIYPVQTGAQLQALTS